MDTAFRRAIVQFFLLCQWNANLDKPQWKCWIKSLIFIMVWFESQNRYFQKIIWYQTKLFWILEQHYFAYPCKHGRAVFKNVKFQTCAFLQEDGNTFLWKNINFQKMRLRKMNEWLSENQINTIYFCTEAQY